MLQQQQRLSWLHSSAFRKPELPRFLIVSELEEIPLPTRRTFLETTPPPSQPRRLSLVTKDSMSVSKCISKGEKACSGDYVGQLRHPEKRGAKDRLRKPHVCPRPRPLSSTPPSPLHRRTAAPMAALISGAPRAAPPPRPPDTLEPSTDLSEDFATPSPFARRCSGANGKPVP